MFKVHPSHSRVALGAESINYDKCNATWGGEGAVGGGRSVGICSVWVRKGVDMCDV